MTEAELIEKVARAIGYDANPIVQQQARAAISVVEANLLRDIKLACVQQSHGPCVCKFVNRIARERGLEIEGMSKKPFWREGNPRLLFVAGFCFGWIVGFLCFSIFFQVDKAMGW